MEILVVTPELSPFARETDAGDTVLALSKHLRHLGHDVTVLLPRYPSIEAHGILLARRLSPLVLPGGAEVAVLDGRLASGVKLCALDAPVLFERPGIYGEDGVAYADNAKRFGLLAQAAVALVHQQREHGSTFDLVQLNDWPAALVPLLLRQADDPSMPTVLTIHDASRQGVFEREQLANLGVSLDQAESLFFDGGLSVLKSGILLANAVTTVSDGYADALSQPEVAGPLATVMGQVALLYGINNGLDYALFSPAADPLIVSRFDAENVTGKAKNKSALLLEHALEVVPTRPLVGCLLDPSQPESQPLLEGSLRGLLKHDLSLLVMVPPGHESGALAEMARRFPGVCAVWPSSAEADKHRLLAASDILLGVDTSSVSSMLPVMAQRYGAVPVCLSTPRSRDQVVDADAELETGTGFLYETPTREALVGAVERALAAYAAGGWVKIRRRVMRLDLSWDRPVRRYLQVFRQVLAQAA